MMSTLRHIAGRTLTLLTVSVLMLLGGAPRAWAIVPPDPTGGSSGAGPGASLPPDGIEVWQVVSIAGTCALLAVLATLVVAHLVTAHRRAARQPSPA